jgi:hypothetical protein
MTRNDRAVNLFAVFEGRLDTETFVIRSVSGGGWTHVVLSEPLNGDFQEGILIGRMELQARSEASSVWGINDER